MNSEIKPITPIKIALINGSIWSIISILFTVLVFYFYFNLMQLTALFTLIKISLGLGLAIYFCFHIRSKIGGYWSFKEALKNIFIMFFTSAVITFFFTILFGRFIDHSYPKKMKEIAITKALDFLKQSGEVQSKIDQELMTIDTAFDQQFNPSIQYILVTVSMIALIYFIGALLFAALFKRERPKNIDNNPLITL